MCGSIALTLPPAPVSGPMLSDRVARPVAAAHNPHFSKWLFFIGLSLIVTPALRVYAIAEKQIPMFLTDKGQMFFILHPGFDKLLEFEICMNVLLVLAAAALNLLFYTHSRRFPNFMVAYVVATFVYRLGATAMLHSLFPDTILVQNAYALLRYFIWGAITAGYLLFEPSVKKHFEH
jgi:Protein of unknown function (DUF2569)